MDINAVGVSSPWYRTLNREQWRVLVAANLAWLFDGFEIYALFLTVGFALHQLLDPAEYAAIPRYAGYVLATTVFGWATGGVIGGDHRRLYRPQADDDAGDPRLFADDRIERASPGIGSPSRYCGFSSASGSARNGRPAPRSSPNCGRTTRAARAAACCNAAPGSAVFLPPACGC